MTSNEAKKDPVISEKLGRRAIFRHSGLQKISLDFYVCHYKHLAMTSNEAKKDPVISEKLGRRAIFRHSGLQKISPLCTKRNLADYPPIFRKSAHCSLSLQRYSLNAASLLH